MRPEVWLPLYERICEDFGFDPEKDLKSAVTLASMIGGKAGPALERIRESFPESVLVCGGGDKLSEELSSMQVDEYVVAADAATTILADAGISVSLIVTDLDGIVEDQIEQNRIGASVFVHAHGDNQEALRQYVPMFTGNLVGTCQCPPPQGVFNFGGFTDGDRAACICAELGAKTIYLVGFDFEHPSGKAGKNRDTKKRKLAWAKIVLATLSNEGVRVLPATDL